MNDNLFQAQYDVTKKSRLRRFYESNKILIFSSVIVFIILFVGFAYYLDSKEKKRISLSEDYVQAKVYLENGERNKATNILTKIIQSNDPTYSTLGLFLIINQNLITDRTELSNLFDYVIENNKFDTEIRNLLIFKKVLLKSEKMSESELLESLKPLTNTETVWKPHAFLLLGDYFVSKKENLKAKEFYLKILAISDLRKDFYEEATFKLALISND